jgi:hypothetical protein
LWRFFTKGRGRLLIRLGSGRRKTTDFGVAAANLQVAARAGEKGARGQALQRWGGKGRANAILMLIFKSIVDGSKTEDFFLGQSHSLGVLPKR